MSIQHNILGFFGSPLTITTELVSTLQGVFTNVRKLSSWLSERETVVQVIIIAITMLKLNKFFDGVGIVERLFLTSRSRYL